MTIPFWDPGARDGQGRAPGIFDGLPKDSAPWPDELSPWDCIYLNGLRAPGIPRLEGGKHIPYDRKAALAQLLAVPTLWAFDPVSFSLILTLWTDDHFRRLAEEIVPQVLPPKGPNPKPRAVSIEYPALALLGVNTVYFEAMSIPRHIGKQIVEVEFQCYEWSPPIPAAPADIDTPLPQGTQPGVTTAPTVTPPSSTSIGP